MVGAVADLSSGATLTGRSDAERLVRQWCFRRGPTGLLGAEIEWFCLGPDGDRVPLDVLGAALGAHAPSTIVASSPAAPMPHGSVVSVEPGGQLELSSAPAPSAAALLADLAADETHLRELLRPYRIELHAGAAEERRPSRRLLSLPRYDAMECRFDRIGPYGRLMMCSTAAVQVTVDAGVDEPEMARRWAMLHAVGPALVAAFAASPRLAGAPEGRWASQRQRTWLPLDPARTRPLSYAGYPTEALEVPLLCVRGADGAPWRAPDGEVTFADWLDGALDETLGRRPVVADLAYHLTTLFPPVRANGYYEIRYLDGQPGDGWRAPVAAIASLAASPATTAEAMRTVAGTEELWIDAARDGLDAPELRRAATDLLTLAATAAPAAQRPLICAAERRCRAGLPPGEDPR
ncbi:ergothioneine biosynthesis glutamate--cysteine ligase EgtA [Tsukamurella pulmonis]|uniref:ergothioneine biosynthesis glutamate--cysteine ligase EgtA n=1 Tax=Tsukamurella pulmonis TaxID=47312 RepID=UPI000E1B905A|nr:ergothioneine biosynthesis glutamate--cysteine ligase EgtA [Tsukamurella pulmonis]